jgi:hypothetical protein
MLLPGVVPAKMNVIVKLAGRLCGAVVEEKRRASGASNRRRTAEGREEQEGRGDENVIKSCSPRLPV